MKITSLEGLVGSSIGRTATPVPRSEIEACQAGRLRRLVEYCRRRSPFYCRRFAAAGITTIEGLADLPALPLTGEEDLRRHGAQMVCVSQDAVSRIITLQSSGTTGPPKRLYFTDADLERTLDFFHRGMQTLVDPGQQVAVLLPGATPDSTGHLLVQALQRMAVSAVTLGLVDDPAGAVRTLHTLRPNVLVGFPVQLLAIARMAEALALPLGPVRSVLLCSDYIPESLSAELARSLGCEVFSHYGTVETGLGGGVDCAAHRGMHLRETDLLVEIIDPHGTSPLAVGQWGEIVVTTLTRTGMPLIRYRTGDRGRLLAGPCPCGSDIRRLDRVFGRISQVGTLQHGDRLALQDLDELLFPIPGLLDFRAGLTNGKEHDILHLALVTIPDAAATVLRQAAARLAPLEAKPNLKLLLTVDPTATIHRGKRILAIKQAENRP